MSKVRIIGGKYKSKNLNVLNLEGLRPTTDRVRETIFNLLNNINNKKVLDLFAGSGVLGIEALSRGAKDVTLVELNKNNADNLKNEALLIDKEHIKVINDNALNYLEHCKETYDLIFLDPPYNSNLLEKAVDLILKHNLIIDNGILYIEMRSTDKKTFVGLECIREQSVGQIKFGLYKKSIFCL